jgi:hypothetical protein
MLLEVFMPSKFYCSISIVALLAACGGTTTPTPVTVAPSTPTGTTVPAVTGGTPTGTTVPAVTGGTPTPVTVAPSTPIISDDFAARTFKFDQDANTLGLSGSGVSVFSTPISGIPTAGSAFYTGAIGINFIDKSEADILAVPSASMTEQIGDGIMGALSVKVDFSPTGGSLNGLAGLFVDKTGNDWSGDIAILRSEITLGSVTYSTGFEGSLTDPSGTLRNFDGGLTGTFSGPGAMVGYVSDDVSKTVGAETFSGAFLVCEQSTCD